MTGPERNQRPGGGRPGVDPEEAFRFYASRSAPERSYRAVGERFGISARTVERYGREGGWRERLQAIDRHAQSELDETLGLERARQLADVKKLIDASFVSYARQLASGDVRFTPGGFVSVVTGIRDRRSGGGRGAVVRAQARGAARAPGGRRV
jgi:hypothetical protein